MMRPRTSALALAWMTGLLVAACGGGGSSGDTEPAQTPAPAPAPTPAPAPAPTPAPTPTPAAPTFARISPDQEAYWAKGTGVRPNLAHLLSIGASPSRSSSESSPSSSAGVVALNAGELSWLRQRVAEASAGGQVAQAGASSAEKSSEIRAQAVAVQRRTVTGLQSFIFHSAAGSVQQPVNLTAGTIEAYAPDGAGGFEQILPSAKRADGTYAIAGVPEGPHWVRLGTRYVWTDQPFVDWSFELFGRADVLFPATPTRLVLNAGNLAAWQTSDSLAWVVPLHGYSFAMPLTDATTANAPRLGETALADFGFELGPNGLFDGLLDAAKGDVAYVNQLATLPAAANPAANGVRVLTRSLVLPPTTTPDGTTTTVNSGFLDIAANAKLHLRWLRSEFTRHGEAVSPGAVLSDSVIGVSAFALPPGLGTPSDAYSLLEFNTLGAGDIDFGALRYGNPFPADWNRLLDAFVGFTKNYLAPGATVSEPLLRGLSTTLLLEAAWRDNASLAIEPSITPPRQPLINGKTLFANQLGVGTSPVLSWSPPERGVASHYFVRILELTSVGLRSAFLFPARLTTAQTTMTLPPGILKPGHLYVITIAATSSSSPITQPNRNGLPFSFATTMSAIVSP
ncbi:MAG: fibronectin type III domain-containing protein [Burkholderiales bacterium]|nr:fibronectin type III domain-containing protein [Burkholderiales bacterium]